jgi:hypothetical protein
VLSPPRGCVPASELAANTLALSGVLCAWCKFSSQSCAPQLSRACIGWCRKHATARAALSVVTCQEVFVCAQQSDQQTSERAVAPPETRSPGCMLTRSVLRRADQLCVYRVGGALRLAARVGDTRPGQMLDVRVRMYLYRWSRPGASRANLLDASEPFQMQVGGAASHRSHLAECT